MTERLSAHELTARHADGSLSPVEATALTLTTIGRLDPTVNAFVLVDEEAALASAKESETRWRKGSRLGPADGVPTSIRGIFLTRGWPTLRGTSLIHAASRWLDDAPAVSRLPSAGGVLLGMTTTPEFAWKGSDSRRIVGTGNPWDASLTPGGASGGSTTAVALDMGTYSLSTDGAGSVRIPAAFTGTVTLKPTYGLVPIFPASPFGTLSHASPMTRSVADASTLLDVLVGFDGPDWSAMPTPPSSSAAGLNVGVKELRVALSPPFDYVNNDPEVETLARQAVGVLVDLNAKLEQVDPGFTAPVDAFDILWRAVAAKVAEAYRPEALEAVDPSLRSAIDLGRSLTASDFLDATAVRIDLGVQTGHLYRTYDLPTATPIPGDLCYLTFGADELQAPSRDGRPGPTGAHRRPCTVLQTEQPTGQRRPEMGVWQRVQHGRQSRGVDSAGLPSAGRDADVQHDPRRLTTIQTDHDRPQWRDDDERTGTRTSPPCRGACR